MDHYIPQTAIEKPILMYPDKSWDWDSLSDNPQVTKGFIKAYPNTDIDLLLHFPDRKWNRHNITFNIRKNNRRIHR